MSEENRIEAMQPFNFSRFFESRGIPQTPGFVRSLEEELARAGLDPVSLDRTSAIRALLLHRHGLPLTEATVYGELISQPSITETVALLIEDGRTLLASGNLSVAEQKLVAALIADIIELYDHPASGNILTYAVAGTIDRWAYDTEILLIHLLTKDVDSQVVLSGELTESADSMLDFLLSPQSLDRFDPAVRDIIYAFRDSVARLQTAPVMADPDSPQIVTLVNDALTQFENSFSTLIAIAELPVIGDNSQMQVIAIMRELFERRIAELRTNLGTILLTDSDEIVTGNVRSIAGLVNRSGIMFEWHLLAWFRAGRDPARLREFYRRDLKGILLAFTRGRLDATDKGSKSNSLGKLRAHAAEVLERIETNQLTSLVDRQIHARTAIMDIPLAGRPGSGHAQIRVTDKNREETRGANPRQFTLSFIVDTSELGLVTAYLTVTGKAVSVAVELADNKWIRLGNGMSDEIRDALSGHGFVVGAVEITHARTPQTGKPAGEDFVA